MLYAQPIQIQPGDVVMDVATCAGVTGNVFR